MNSVNPYIKTTFSIIGRRNFGSCSVLYSKVLDPVQQLFLDKIREFKTKITDKNFLKENPGLQDEINNEIARLQRQYGGSNAEELNQFPKLKIEEPKVDPQIGT